ncbi:hypothetical protein QTH97_34270 [Variovorax sp. J22R24]|uniref:effector-associated constant component EACC1 n=1 Tax=Variovorax gracilis TaxID=3053502 RepID=UPI0025769F2D|nr:hypothetical protein [Variovorax sp. J22R24]MDM0110016.1 hypothetical protein [Variovorax sp. J22R24]
MELQFDVYVPGADAARIEVMVSNLLAEIRERDIGFRAERLTPEPAPGSKAGGEFGAAQLALTLLGSGGVAVTVLGVVKDWLARQPPQTHLKIKIGGEELELSTANLEFASQASEAFLQKAANVRKD